MIALLDHFTRSSFLHLPYCVFKFSTHGRLSGCLVDWHIARVASTKTYTKTLYVDDMFPFNILHMSQRFPFFWAYNNNIMISPWGRHKWWLVGVIWNPRMYIYIYIYMVPCPVFPPPPWDGGGVWCPCGGVYTYIHTYMHTYHYITLPYLTLPYLTLHSIHTYIHTYMHTCIHAYMHTCIHAYMHTCIHAYQHTNIPTYQHTNIPTYHHHRPQGGGPEEPYHHHRPQGGGTRRTIPPPQATGGGGPEEPYHHHRPQGGGTRRTRRYCPPIPIGGGGEGGWPTLHHIYIFNIHVIIHIWKAFIPLHQKNMSVLGNIINSHPPTQLIIKFLLAIFISISVWLDHVTPYFWW